MGTSLLPSAQAQEEGPSDTPSSSQDEGETNPTPAPEAMPPPVSEPEADEEQRSHAAPPDELEETPQALAPVSAPPQSLDEALRDLDTTGSPPLPPREGEQAELELEPLPEGEKRALPDYEGRPAEPLYASDVLLWIPRALFLPVAWVFDYGLRRPIVGSITFVEEHNIADKVRDFFTWDEGRAALYPMIYLDFGVRPNLGLTLNWDEIFPRHDLNLGAFLGFNDLWASALTLDQRIFQNEEVFLRWQIGYIRRPDNVYFGLSDIDDRCNSERRGCRYRSAIAEARLHVVAWEESLQYVQFGATFRQARFSTESDPRHPALTEQEASTLAHFDGYQIVRPEIEFAFDTRPESVDFSRGSGLRFEGSTSFNVDVTDPSLRWFRAGGELSGFYDLGYGQTLGLGLYYEGIENLGGRTASGQRTAVPFHELIWMGGTEHMMGFLPGRLRGPNAWSATFEYRYPITWALDAALFSSIGNTFDNWDEVDLKRNYLNYGLALKLSGDRARSFQAVLGWGSNRLDEPEFDPFNQFRLSLGINRGF